jgi:hypothetical protein
MAEGMDVFKARISATDDTSAVMKLIIANAKLLGHELEQVGRKQHELHEPQIWDRLRENAKGAGEAVHRLGEHFEFVKGGMEHVIELIPQLGALTALGGAAGLAENVYKTAEGYAELAHTAESLGMQADALQRWNGIAKLTDTNAESMGKSMGRLNRVLGEVTHGKNKDAAALFKALKLNPHNFRDAADALPALSAAFQHTHDTGLRARMAFELFGKAGADMIPMLELGPDKLREIGSEVDKSSFKFGAAGESLLAMKMHMGELELTVQGFMNELGTGLAPVLDPVILKMKGWLQANKDWLATKIIDDVRWLRDIIEHTDWERVETAFEKWGTAAGHLVDDIGGITRSVEILGGVIVGRSVLSFAGDIAAAKGLFGTLKLGWAGVGAAATEAATAEALAAAGGGGGGKLGTVRKVLNSGGAAVTGLAGAAALGTWVYAYEENKGPAQEAWRRTVTIPNSIASNEDAVRIRYENASPQWRARFDAEEAKHGGHVIRDQDRELARERDGYNSAYPHGGFPITSAPSAAPAAQPATAGHVAVTVDFRNAPPGVTASATSSGAVGAIKINKGQAFHDVN